MRGVDACEKKVCEPLEISEIPCKIMGMAFGASQPELMLEDFSPRPMRGAPGPVLEALEKADVGILAMNPQPGELTARMAIVQIVERRRIRYAHMVGVTPQIMQQGMRADYKMVDRLSD